MLMSVIEIKEALDCCIENQRLYDVEKELSKCHSCPLKHDKKCYDTLLKNVRLFVNDYVVINDDSD